jgi:3-phosphoshikimate 1-carboxyvinyltransferase
MQMAIAPRQGGVPADLGRPELPGSKSHTQRAMLLAGFLPGAWCLRAALRSDDTEVLAAMLRACGAALEWRGRDLLVVGRDPAAPLAVSVTAGENGTAARMLAMIVPLLGGRLALDGAPSLRARPFAPAIAALRAAGVVVDGDSLPLRLDGGAVRALPAAVAADVTTQPASGVFVAAALRGGGTLRAERPGDPGYLQLTAASLRAFGYRATAAMVGEHWQLAVAGAPRRGGEVAIPVDASARAFPLALAELCRRDGPALLPVLADDPHPDWAIDGDLRQLRGRGDVVLDGVAQRPDCLPALAVCAALRTGTTRLPGLGTLRGKESDRLGAMVTGLTAAGVAAHCDGDVLVITGPPRPSASALRLPAPADHRVVMALALLGAVLPAGVVVDHAEAVAKSWPEFFTWLGRCAEVRSA